MSDESKRGRPSKGPEPPKKEEVPPQKRKLGPALVQQIAERAQEVRKEKGWTLEDVARRTEKLVPDPKDSLTTGGVAKLLRGESTDMYISSVLLLAKVLDVDVEELVGGDKVIESLWKRGEEKKAGRARGRGGQRR